MAEVLEVEKRERVGSSATQKLRRTGRVPAVLYGHGEENAHLSIPERQVQTLIRHHSKTVELISHMEAIEIHSGWAWVSTPGYIIIL